ncbi:MAG: hypothetical protein ABSD64_14085 [Terriglobales bacterium]|jgi:hypothetical protein
MPERKETSQLIGEFFREFAVLLAALLPLEEWIQKGTLKWDEVLLAEVIAFIVLGWGIVLEGRDEL